MQTSARFRDSVVSREVLLGPRRPRPHKIWKKKFIKVRLLASPDGPVSAPSFNRQGLMSGWRPLSKIECSLRVCRQLKESYRPAEIATEL